jgi:8-oxo-dGTP pyrophosphatase MutT (NUDIX family)
VVRRFDTALRALIGANLSRLDRRSIDVGELRHAAVTVCVVADDDGTACFVLTRRAAGMRAHSRQWALPGGRLDDGETPVGAARREAFEEVGLDAKAEDVVGLLDDYRTRSGFVITPVVLWCDDPGSLVANADEVAAIHLVPLDELDHPDAPRMIAIPESDAPVVLMPIMGEWIHAPTAAVLLQFRDVALRGLDTRVSDLEQPTWAWR